VVLVEERDPVGRFTATLAPLEVSDFDETSLVGGLLGVIRAAPGIRSSASSPRPGECLRGELSNGHAALAVKRSQGVRLGRPSTTPKQVVNRIRRERAGRHEPRCDRRRLNADGVPRAASPPDSLPHPGERGRLPEDVLDNARRADCGFAPHEQQPAAPVGRGLERAPELLWLRLTPNQLLQLDSPGPTTRLPRTRRHAA
jgi:hypothetical protein